MTRNMDMGFTSGRITEFIWGIGVTESSMESEYTLTVTLPKDLEFGKMVRD